MDDVRDRALLQRLASAEVRLTGITTLLHDVRLATNGWICNSPNLTCTHQICWVLDAVNRFAHQDELRRRAFNAEHSILARLEYPADYAPPEPQALAS